jgi:hypothetical protein
MRIRYDMGGGGLASAGVPGARCRERPCEGCEVLARRAAPATRSRPLQLAAPGHRPALCDRSPQHGPPGQRRATSQAGRVFGCWSDAHRAERPRKTTSTELACCEQQYLRLGAMNESKSTSNCFPPSNAEQIDPAWKSTLSQLTQPFGTQDHTHAFAIDSPAGIYLHRGSAT